MRIRMTWVLSGWLAALLLATGGAWLAVPVSLGQQAAPAATDPESMFPGGYMGSTDCLSCHKGQIRPQKFVRLIEPAIWSTDPHSKAFEFINWSESAETASRKLSREICDKLGIPDIRQARQCLSCHANWVTGLSKPPPFYQDGVGCESCHGPSLKWELLHRQPNWRALPVAEKAAKQMIDVRHPVRRAEQCFSCHIGNIAEGKLITHAMYAAGHPPLPSIEIESFADQMPRHWRYLEEKIADSRDEAGADPAAPPFEFFNEFVRENHAYLKADRPAETLQMVAGHHHGAAAVVLGGVVAMRESIELTRDLARPEATSGGPAWPEFSSFDCTACHHDLKRDSGRQSYPAGHRPGRPALHAWPRALVRLAIFHIAVDAASYDRKLAEFNQMLNALHVEVAETPFGNPTQLHSAADALAAWLTDELIDPVAEKPFDNRAVRLACVRLAYLGGTAEQPSIDFDSARQIAWALRTLYCSLDTKPHRDQEIQSLFQRLAGDLRLDLPNGAEAHCQSSVAREPRETLPGNPGAIPSPTPLTGAVSATLAAEVRFDPQRFVETMRQFQALLK